jgi:hypothetical protein
MKSSFFLILMCCGLAACGGGGSSDSATTAPAVTSRCAGNLFGTVDVSASEFASYFSAGTYIGCTVPNCVSHAGLIVSQNGTGGGLSGHVFATSSLCKSTTTTPALVFFSGAWDNGTPISNAQFNESTGKITNFLLFDASSNFFMP